MPVPDVPRLTLRPLPELAEERFDLIVVGGGITGAGVARHAAAAGLRTLLLEAQDFASGTSSRSTKLVHGGLRYLAMGDVALVREGVLERKSLLAMAPHLTEPRWMLVPARTRLQFAQLRAGISLYEWLGAVSRAERHRNLRGSELAEAEPLLDRRLTPWACLYREYLTDDARLVLATLRASAARGGQALNYAQVESVEQTGGGCTVLAADRRTGERCRLEARCVVNAAGPWVEGLLGSADGRHPRLYLSKGVHLVLPHARLPVRNMVMMAAADGRPVFAIGRGAVTYVGTTDTTHEGRPEHWPEVTDDDVSYLLATVNAHFDLPPVSAEEVLDTWAGLRPLINQPGKAPKEMSRRDEIWRDGAMVTVAGGKLTGFRRMAAQTMRVVGQVLGVDVSMGDPLAPLPGGLVGDVELLVAEVRARYSLKEPVAARLVRHYGSEVWQVLGERPTPVSASMFMEEVDWAMNVEGALTLEDVVYRRLRAGWFLPAEVESLLPAAVRRLSEPLRWDQEQATAQIDLIRRRQAEALGFRQSAVSGATR